MVHLTINYNSKDINSFNKEVEANKFIIVAVHMDGCGHCIDLYQNIWSKIKKMNVTSAWVDMSVQKKLNVLNKLNIEGFPHIVGIKNKKLINYNGERDLDSIVSWIESNNSQKAGGRKDGQGNRITKNTKKKDNRGRTLGTAKGTRVKIQNIQKSNNKKPNTKRKNKKGGHMEMIMIPLLSAAGYANYKYGINSKKTRKRNNKKRKLSRKRTKKGGDKLCGPGRIMHHGKCESEKAIKMKQLRQAIPQQDPYSNF